MLRENLKTAINYETTHIFCGVPRWPPYVGTQSFCASLRSLTDEADHGHCCAAFPTQLFFFASLYSSNRNSLSASLRQTTTCTCQTPDHLSPLVFPIPEVCSAQCTSLSGCSMLNGIGSFKPPQSVHLIIIPLQKPANQSEPNAGVEWKESPSQEARKAADPQRPRNISNSQYNRSLLFSLCDTGLRKNVVQLPSVKSSVIKSSRYAETE